MQQAQPQETLKSDPSFDGSAKVFSSKGSMKSENLKKPLFVLADWTTWFLPTLYHFLFCSEKPFHEFGKGSAFVTTVQEILDIIHPGNTYIVTSSCKIYTTVMYLFLCLIHSLMKPLIVGIWSDHWKMVWFRNTSFAFGRYPFQTRRIHKQPQHNCQICKMGHKRGWTSIVEGSFCRGLESSQQWLYHKTKFI